MPERRKLPVILSADEVVRFLEAVPSLKTRTALDDGLCGGPSRLGGGEPQGGGYRRSRMLACATARERRTGPSCVAEFWRSCAPTGVWPGRESGCFPAAREQADRRAGPARGLPLGNQGGGAGQAHRVHTLRPALLPICSRAASTSASSRCFWATTACRRRPAIRKWRRPPFGARSTAWSGGGAAA